MRSLSAVQFVETMVGSPGILRAEAQLRGIALEVSRATGIPYSAIMAPTRHSKQAFAARCLVAYTAQQQGYSLAAIGRALRRDHTSVLNMLRRAGSVMADLERSTATKEPRP